MVGVSLVVCYQLSCSVIDSDDSIDLFDMDAGETGDFDDEGSHADSDPDEENQYYYKDFFDPVPASDTAHPPIDTSQPLEVPLSAHQKKQKKVRICRTVAMMSFRVLYNTIYC